MRAVDIIEKKRDKQALSSDEIEWFIREYTQGNVPDYQAAALMMAIYFNGMTRAETSALTLAMAHSGEMMDLSDIAAYIVDKHSSGGVGDKTTLIVLPLVAACGVKIAKMSGRGLGFSGGTLDKLESIAGFRVDYSDDDFHRMAREHGLILAGQTGELAPADGKLYALRDVTATVPSLPLIASSIMSKKLAGGANGIVLDVKCGVGAFMATVDEARTLAQEMVTIGIDAGRDIVALLSDMNQPLGQTVGNALEVREAIDVLRGGGTADVVEHCLQVADYMLQLAGRGDRWTNSAENRALLQRKLDAGAAFDRFREMVVNQGGDVRMVDDPAQLPQATIQQDVVAPQAGYVETVSADHVARAALALGAGRAKKGDAVDAAVGVEVFVTVGDQVAQGDLVARIHANDEASAETARDHLQTALDYSDASVDPLPHFYGVIDSRTHQGASKSSVADT